MTVNPKFAKRFSIAHWDHADNPESTFSRILLNSSAEYQAEINDIYFGRAFYYSWNGMNRRYGDVMGREASDGQVRDLLDVQEKLGIPISLTLNDENIMPEIVGDKDVREAFISWLKTFYDAGVRICTISDKHLMASGALQEAFPEMHWKNTVNHLVRSAQEVVDYIALGYNTILVDRSMNRNVDELKASYKAAHARGAKISLLASEGCMPSCPFKKEHDTNQAAFQNGFNPTSNQTMTGSYWTVMGGLSCNRWRKSLLEKDKESGIIDPGTSMPRVGTDIVALDKETFDIFLDNTDILKFSGRLHDSFFEPDGSRFMLAFAPGVGRFDDSLKNMLPNDQQVLAESWSEIYEKNLVPFHSWRPYVARPTQEGPVTKEQVQEWQEANYENMYSQSIWATKKAKGFDRILRNCRNQCYDCHACEKVFGYKPVDSLLQVSSAKGWIEKADTKVLLGGIGKHPDLSPKEVKVEETPEDQKTAY